MWVAIAPVHPTDPPALLALLVCYQDRTVRNVSATFQEQTGVAASNIVEWATDSTRAKIAKAAAGEHADSLLAIDKSSRKTGKYGRMEQELVQELHARRRRGLKCSARWLTHAARILMKRLYPDIPENSFKGGKDWRARFLARFKFTIRRKTNRKNVTWEETRPILQRYFKRLRMRLMTPEVTTLNVHPKWGTYINWQRANVDQSPLPFTNGADATYDEIGAKRVPINQGNDAWHKRQYTVQLAFRPALPPLPTTETAAARFDKHLQHQQRPAIVFRGQGRVSQAERDGYHQDVDVYWQPNAWVDSTVANEWVSKQPGVQRRELSSR